jgi:hypothetical protein
MWKTGWTKSGTGAVERKKAGWQPAFFRNNMG